MRKAASLLLTHLVSLIPLLLLFKADDSGHCPPPKLFRTHCTAWTVFGHTMVLCILLFCIVQRMIYHSQAFSFE